MSLIKSFKKDYFNYLISVIIPVIINAISIPIFKILLGASKYGHFSLLLNTILIVTSFLAGWIWPSIILNYHNYYDKNKFVSLSLKIGLLTFLSSAILSFLICRYLKKDINFSIFFSITLIFTSLYFIILAISQSMLLSKKNIVSEIIRSISFFILVTFLLHYIKLPYTTALFISIIFAYLLAFYYLYKHVRVTIGTLATNEQIENLNLSNLAKRFAVYGFPLSLWFLFSQGIMITDKFFLSNFYQSTYFGNYQANYDVLSKAIIILLSPVGITLLPMVAKSHNSSKYKELKQLLYKIVLIEVGLLIFTLLNYWFWGYKIVFNLVDIPNEAVYKVGGMLIISASFIWQMAMVVQKFLELEQRSKTMLAMVVAAFAIQIIFYIAFKNKNALIFPAGLLVASTAYFVLIVCKSYQMMTKNILHP